MGVGEGDVFLAFYAISNISKKNILGIQKIFFFRKSILFHLMFSISNIFWEVLKSAPSLTG